MPYWITKLSNLENGSRRLCRIGKQNVSDNQDWRICTNEKENPSHPTYPGCICGWDFQQADDNPQTGIHVALQRNISATDFVKCVCAGPSIRIHLSDHDGKKRQSEINHNFKAPSYWTWQGHHCRMHFPPALITLNHIRPWLSERRSQYLPSEEAHRAVLWGRSGTGCRWLSTSCWESPWEEPPWTWQCCPGNAA